MVGACEAVTPREVKASAGQRIRFNPFDPEFRRDPYPTYALLRAARPSRSLGTLILTRYEDVVAALKTRAFSVDLIPQTILRHAEKLGLSNIGLADRFIRSSLVFTDDPAHTRLRRLLNQVFVPAFLEELRPAIRARVRDLLDAKFNPSSFDVVEDLAAPLPLGVLCDWMGVPTRDQPEIGRHIHAIRALLDPGMMTRVGLEHVLLSLSDLTDYMSLRVAKVDLALGPLGALVERLAAARFEGQGLSQEEIAFACIMCFVAGGETTQCLIGNTVRALLEHPDQLELLRSDPSSRITATIEESIRYETPLQMTKRLALEDTVIGGEEVFKGEQILLCLAAANRDPLAFPDPDRFDITREVRPHVGFGYGMHACLGGALARMQAEIAVEALLEREPVLRRADPADSWQSHSLILRGMTSLPIRRSNSTRKLTKTRRARRPGWLYLDADATHAKAHLVCFPHAGGGVASFNAWRRDLPQTIALHKVQLPKSHGPQQHGFADPHLQNLISGLSDAFREAVEAGAIAEPYAFYGHSLGALIAYELANGLRRSGLPCPAHLFVSGRRAPRCKLQRPPLCSLPEELLISELARLGGMPSVLVNNRRWLELMLPNVRAELALSDLYEPRGYVPLKCGIHAFKGNDDPILNDEELAAWHQETVSSFRMESLPGSHFFDEIGLVRLRRTLVETLDASINRRIEEPCQ